jgi:hypothetical protein
MNYISLKEAARFCDYSQEYLSLRARRGKLKAVKFGRNWMTSKEWLDEYLAGAEKYHDIIESKKKIEKVVRISQPLPPDNLPIDRLIKMKFSLGDIRPSLVSILVMILLGASWFSARETIFEAYSYLSPYVTEIGRAGDFLIQEGGDSLASVSEDIKGLSDDAYLAALRPDDTLKFTTSILGEYGQWLRNALIK